MLATNNPTRCGDPGRSREDKLKGTETAHCGETDSAGDKEYTIDKNVSYD